MKYRRLGDAGVRLSEIGLGGWLTVGNAQEMEQTSAVLNKAFELGINFLDTANVYAGGKAEEVWGELLAPRRRSDYVLATKVFFPMGPGPNDHGLSRKHIFEQCHASLKRLRTDYIDLYQCHRFAIDGIDDGVELEETVRAMDDLIHQGKVLYWGFSEWPVDEIVAALGICGDRFYKPKSSQPRYSAIQRHWEEPLFPLCHAAGIGQVVFSPLAQGILSGKYKPGQPLPPDSRAADDRQNQFMKRNVEDQALLKRVQQLAPIAARFKLTMSQLALAWVLHHPAVTSCIVGASRPSQLEENAAASGVLLDDATVNEINTILG